MLKGFLDWLQGGITGWVHIPVVWLVAAILVVAFAPAWGSRIWASVKYKDD